ncbi:beta-lactamase family protein [Granulosicoccus sp.]|nr:beta-lactamase family protein [Granulosicoccus sp.]
MNNHEVHAYWIASEGHEGQVGSSDALFPFWSFTKTVISACALKLVEDGSLDLNARLPGEPFSLRQLLAHTSGLADYGHFKEYHDAVEAGGPSWSRERVLKLGLSKGQLFRPGEGWSYSNIGYMFVRQLIEDATGMSLGEVIAELIAKPLGLTSIELSETRIQFSKLHWDSAKTYDPGWVYHGCLVGTAPDASRLLRSLLSGEILSADTLDQMLSTRPLGGPIPERPWENVGYGLGIAVGKMKDVGTTIGHIGVGPFSVSAVYHYPDRVYPITIACFTNGSTEGDVEFAALELVKGR